MERNHFLDCIRALAVFLVLAVHAHLLVGGGIGVSIFFCLSGYLIATILLHIDPSPAGRWTLLWSALVGIGLAWFAKFYVGGGHQGLYGQIYPHVLYPLLPTIVYLDKLMIGVLCALVVQSNSRLAQAFLSSRALGLWMPIAAIFTLSTLTFRDLIGLGIWHRAALPISPP